MSWRFWRRRDTDLDRELAAHLELEEEARRRDGLSAEEARHAARRDLGNLTLVKETVHEMRPLTALEGWLGDLRYTARSLRRNPGFACVAIVVLALGIGAATAIFTIADQALLRLLPVKEPARLRLIEWNGNFIGGTSRGGQDCFSYPVFRELEQARTDALDGVAAMFPELVAVEIGTGIARANAELVSGEYFDVLGVGATLGRTIAPEDDQERDGEPWVVLSYDYWRNRFGASPSVLGQSIRVNGFPMTVIGVAEARFKGFDAFRPADLFVPMRMKTVVTPTWDDRDRRDSIWLNIFARLAPAADPGEAQSALMAPYTAALRKDLAAHPRDKETSARYLKNRIELNEASRGLGGTRKYVATPLHILLAMVGGLVLITCVNVASLLVVRLAKREKEIAVRGSLGASRFSMVRLVLTECLLLSVSGAVLGLPIARIGAALLVRILPADQLGLAFDPTPDWRGLAFAAALAVFTALLFGIAPVFQLARSSSAPALKREASSVSLGRGHTRFRRMLVVAQVALSLILLATAGLFGKSLRKIFEVDSGLAVDHLLQCSIDPSQHRYTPQQARPLVVDLQRRLGLVPGAVSASAAAEAALSGGGWQSTIKVEGHQAGEDENMQAGTERVLPGFFQTMGIKLLAGRDFDERDADGAREVIIVNAALANRFFGSPGNAIGRHTGVFFHQDPLPYEIVGVVADHKSADLKEEFWPRTYHPLLQADRIGQVTFYLRARGNPESLSGAVQTAIHAADPSLAVFDVKTVAQQVNETHFIDRLFAQLSAAFAVIATLLAAIGLYGVAAFSVARRTHEIGVRMALGAQRGQIFGMVLREAMTLAGIGMLVGAPLALAIGKLVEAQLFGVAAVDAGVSAAAAAALLAASALAGYLPARRAMQTSPAMALRHEL